MNATSARFVRVVHVVTLAVPWSDKHQQAVNAQLAGLSGNAIIISVEHSGAIVHTPDGYEHQFSTLITYRRLGDPEEESDE